MISTIVLFGITIKLYDLFFVGGFIGVFVYLFCICKEYDIKRSQSIIFTVLVYTMTLVWMFFLYWADTGFKQFGGNNIVRVFWWLGVFVYPVSKLLHLDFYKCLDFVSPCLCINHGIAHIGCIFAGCCHGYPCRWGILNNNFLFGTKTFPIQPIEAGVAIGIAVFIWMREKRKGYGKGIDGLSFPIMLMLFGYSRFFLEFLRDNDKLFYITQSVQWNGKPVFGVSDLALHALLNAIIGSVSYYIIKSKNGMSRRKTRS